MYPAKIAENSILRTQFLMMKITKFFCFTAFFAFVVSCNNDDDNSIQIRDFGEVAIENEAEIQDFLETHFYNYEDFQNPPDGFNFKITIDTIAGENAGKIPLSEFVSSKVVNVNDVDLKLYWVVVRQGGGERAKVTDSTLIRFRGTLLNRNRFDVSDVPVWFNAPSLVQGMREFVGELNASTGSTKNPDGTINFNNDFGLGIVIMPSGLGYFANTTIPGVPQYSPLIFTVDMLERKPADQDADRILNEVEDLDGDGDPFNDDTDGDDTPNFADIDDDGDGILTRFEITINEDGTITFPDCDNDGVPDYLDKDICR